MPDTDRGSPAHTLVSSVVADAREPERIAHFWQQLIGGEIVTHLGPDVVTLRAPGVTIDFVSVPDDKTTKNRWHVDLAGPDAAASVRRAIELGATEAPDICVTDRFTVLRDPEGNEFCVLHHHATTPWEPVT